jgi:hypothetical protein
MQTSKNLTAFQSAWVVDDIEKAALEWVESAGVGPFYIAEFQPGMLVDTFYREQPAPMSMITALTQVGDMQLELIQPTGDQANIYRDTVPAGHSAFHHICLWSDRIAEDLDRYRKQGFEIAARGRMDGGAAFAYVDTHIVLGHMTELLERTPEVEALFDMIAASASNWDGKDPIREYD